MIASKLFKTHNCKKSALSKRVTLLIGEDQSLDQVRGQTCPEIHERDRTENHPSKAKLFLTSSHRTGRCEVATHHLQSLWRYLGRTIDPARFGVQKNTWMCLKMRDHVGHTDIPYFIYGSQQKYRK